MHNKPPIWQRLTLLAAVLLAHLVIYQVWLAADIPPPRDNDLVPASPAVSRDDNAYFLWNDLPWRVYVNEPRLKPLYFQPANWSDDTARSLLADEADILRRYDATRKTPELVAPPIRDADQRIPYLAAWRHASRLAAIRSELHARQGNERQALEEAVDIIRFSHHIAKGNGCEIQVVVSYLVLETGCKQAESVLRRKRMPVELLNQLASEIPDLVPDEHDLDVARQIEYQVSRRLALAHTHGTDTSIIPPFPFGRELYFKPHWLQARLIRDSYSTTSGSFPYAFDRGSDWPGNQARIWGSVSCQSSLAATAVTPNSLGIILYPLIDSIVPGAAKLEMTDKRIRLDVLQLQLALLAYEADMGELPAALDALSPRFISHALRDPYDTYGFFTPDYTPPEGSSVIAYGYSPKERILYSVGPNGFDDHADWVAWRDKWKDAPPPPPPDPENLFRDPPSVRPQEPDWRAHDIVFDIPNPPRTAL